MTPQEISKLLQKTDIFLAWKQAHPSGFLTHFFVPATSAGELKSDWEIGFYDPQQEKITTFVQEGEHFWQKPEDEVFKKPTDTIVPLHLQEVSLSYEEAMAICQKTIKEKFSKEVAGDGFVILQQLGLPLWNFTFLCRSLAFVNVKINAASGAVHEHQRVEVVRKEQGADAPQL